MAVYVIVIAAAIVLLAASYRAFGGAQQRTPEAGVLLAQGHRALTDNLGAFDRLAVTTPADEELVRQGRKGAATLQHVLDLLPAQGSLPEADERLRALLAAAAEDLSWAWRLVATAGAQSDGPAEAVGKLRDHAARCAAEAGALLGGADLGPAASAEPLEGP